MKFSDTVKMCLNSLKRRKGRTILTVLGVFIGCVSIIIMVSIGAGMRESYNHMIYSMGDITMVEVYGGNSSEAKLDDNAVKSFREISGVQAVMGTLGVDCGMAVTAGTNDRYVSDWCSSSGYDTSALSDMGFELVSGRFPQAPNEIVVGEYFAYIFRDSLLPDGSNYRERYKWDDMTGEQLDPDDPFFDPLNMSVKVVYTSWDNENSPSLTREYTVVGVTKEDYNKGYATSEGIILDVDEVREINAFLMNVPVASVKLSYSEILVKATSLSEVSAVDQAIADLGYSTYSMESMRKELEKEARQIELMLGGLGAISLLVAAIGIANTMTMSITERTKEIGIMKTLGCYIRDIRTMFLMEAGLIGLIGGVLGLIFSYIVSIIINLVSFGVLGQGVTLDIIKAAAFGSPDYTRISVISPALIVFAIAFSFAVGLLSGYHPANKAVKISALEAIRNE